MTLTRRPSPFGELVTLRQAMDRLFDDTVFRPYAASTGGELARLPLDVRSTPDALLVEASLPGIKPEDVEITVENGTLTIRAEDRTDERPRGRWLGRPRDRARQRDADRDPADRPRGRQGRGHLRARRAPAALPEGRAGQAAPDPDPAGDRRARPRPSRPAAGRPPSPPGTEPSPWRQRAGPIRDATRPVYVISVAATLVSAHPRTLRIYEDEGLVCPARTPTNIRLYSEEDIRRILWIRHLTRDRGVNLAGVRTLFELEERLGKRILEALYDEGTRDGAAGAATAGRADGPPESRPGRRFGPAPRDATTTTDNPHRTVAGPADRHPRRP